MTCLFSFKEINWSEICLSTQKQWVWRINSLINLLVNVFRNIKLCKKYKWSVFYAQDKIYDSQKWNSLKIESWTNIRFVVVIMIIFCSISRFTLKIKIIHLIYMECLSYFSIVMLYCFVLMAHQLYYIR